MSLTVHRAPVVLPILAEPIVDGAVAVDGDRVLLVGGAHEVCATLPDARVRTWPGVLTPGLVNAHAHLQYTDFADLAGAGLAFPEWIARLVARRAEFTARQWRTSARRGVHALLATGTTAVADIVTDLPALEPVARSGLAGVSYLEVVAQDSARWADAGRAALVSALDSVTGGRRIGVSPHTVYTLSAEVLRETALIARERGLRLHPHLAETAAENAYVATGEGPLAAFARRVGLDMERPGAGRPGVSPARYLDSLGGLGPDVHVAHAVHCDERDRAMLRERGTSVALCVRSNRVLAAGEPPVAAFLREDAPLAVGTDSLASSPSLDLLAEAAAVRALARAQGYQREDLAQRVVTACTLGGARAMGSDEIGLLRPGGRADLAVFDVPAAAGHADPYAALLDHGPGRCVATVLGGRLVHRAR